MTTGFRSLVLPAFPFGPTPEHRNYGSGYIDIPVDVHDSLIFSVLTSLAEQGFRKIVVWRGCGGHDLRGTVDRFNDAFGGRTEGVPAGPPVSRHLVPAGGCVRTGRSRRQLHDFHRPPPPPGSGSEGQDRRSRARPVDWSDPDLDFSRYSPTGVIGDPTHASAELGAKLWEAVISAVASIFRSVGENDATFGS